MPTNREVLKLKRRVGYFEKQSFIRELNIYLSRHPEGSIEKYKQMPSFVYLLLEWVFEVEYKETPRITTARDVSWFMNRIWKINNSFGANRKTDSVTLFLRPIINNQFWIQQDGSYWLRGILLQYAIMLPKGSSPFYDEFLQATKVDLDDYFQISAIVMITLDSQQRAISYSNVVRLLYPYFTIDIIARSLRVFAMLPDEIKLFLTKKVPRSESLVLLNAETRLIHCPVIFIADSLYAPDHALLRRGISESAFNHFLRLNRSGFRQRYGNAYENYVRGCLFRDDISFSSEAAIERIYKSNNISGKVVDALVEGTNGVVLVEAKGVVPKVETLTSAEPYVIRNHLKDTVLKAAKQIVECLYKLEKCQHPLPLLNERFGLIVTQGEYYLKRFSEIAKYIAGDTMANLENKFGKLIPYENIFVCNVNDLDYLVGTEAKCDDFLVTFMQHCKKEDADSNTSKMLMTQHIESFFSMLHESQGAEYKRAKETKVRDESLTNKIETLTKTNKEYWNTSSETELVERTNQLKAAIRDSASDQLKMQS